MNPNQTPPPHDLDAEVAVLSAVMLDPSVVDELGSVLRSTDFYSPPNALVWEAVIALASSGAPIDTLTVASKLKDLGKLQQVGGNAYLARIVDTAPFVSHLPTYAHRVTSLSRLRKCIAEAHRIAGEGYGAGGMVDVFIERAESAMSAIVRDGSVRKTESQSMHELVVSTWRDIEARSRNEIDPVRSHFRDLDHVLMSEEGEVQIIAGRPGMGKTTFALECLRQGAAAVVRPYASVVFSLEMKGIPLMKRWVSSVAGVPLRDIRRGQISSDQWVKMNAAGAHLSSLPIQVDTVAGLTMLEMRSRFRQARQKLEKSHPGVPLRACVIDYMQLMRKDPGSTASNREQEIAEISRGLTQFAFEENVLVIALAQLNRAVEKQGDKRPGMADIRESGAIEQDATSILMLYRDEQYNPESKDKGLCEVIIAKSRNDEVTRVLLEFDSHYTRFRDYTPPANGYRGA